MEAIMTNATKKIAQVSGKLLAKAKYHLPEILLVTGVVGAVTTVVMACKATTNLEPVIDKLEEEKEQINKTAEESPEEYTDEMKTKDLARTYAETGLELVKLYGPAALVMTGSIAAILGSYGIIKGRNAALVSAYSILETSFNKYRTRVKDKYGEDAEKDIRYGVAKQEFEVLTTDAKGKEKVKKEKVAAMDGDVNNISPYAKFFDEMSTEWQKNPEYNLFFLNSQQTYANDKLNADGYLFLNDVYKALGLPITKTGQMVGWLKDGNGDGYVDFGMYNGNKPCVRDFINGYEQSILLDFNVDGVIWDKI